MDSKWTERIEEFDSIAFFEVYKFGPVFKINEGIFNGVSTRASHYLQKGQTFESTLDWIPNVGGETNAEMYFNLKRWARSRALEQVPVPVDKYHTPLPYGSSLDFQQLPLKYQK